VSSHVLQLWPFVLKRTLLQERAAGDYTFEQAVAVIARVRADLATARRQRLESLEQLNELRAALENEKAFAQRTYDGHAKTINELRVDVHDLTVERDQLKAQIEANSIANWRKATAEILQLRADLKEAANTIMRLKSGMVLGRGVLV
jgi:chromosome segregation ATPase